MAGAYRNDLDHPFRALSERRVQEERVDLAVVQGLHRANARRYLDVRGREAGVLEVLHAVVVRDLPLRHRRIADAHPRPFGDLRGHQLHGARRRRVEREVHPPERLLREVEVLQKPLGAERRADDLGFRHVHEMVVPERQPLDLDSGGLEHVAHDGDAEVVVRRGPEVEGRVALAVRDLDLLGRERTRGKRREEQGQ